MLFIPKKLKMSIIEDLENYVEKTKMTYSQRLIFLLSFIWFKVRYNILWRMILKLLSIWVLKIWLERFVELERDVKTFNRLYLIL